MKMQEFTIKSSNRINRLAGYKYDVSSDFLKGALIIVHGVNDHIGRYRPFISYLNERGYAVVGYDQLGHGKTAKTKDDLGFFGLHNGQEYLVNDVKLVVDQTKIWFSNVPIVILGHSMGSLVGRAFIERHGNLVAGFIMMGSLGAEKAAIYRLNRALLKLLMFFKGKRGRSKLVTKMAFGPYLKGIEQPVNSSAWLSKEKQICIDYQKDPFCNYITTISAFLAILELQQRVNQTEWFDKVAEDLALLIVSGQEDPCGQYGVAIKNIYDKLQGRLKDVKMILYADDRHEILNETDKEKVYADIEGWLNHLCKKNHFIG